MALKRGTKGNDSFIATAMAEQFDGIQGYDKVIYANAASGITINLGSLGSNTGDAAGDTYKNVSSYLLTKHDDTFIGSTGKDVVNGDNGNDRLEGRDNNDTMTGHSGNDTIIGGNGNDTIYGGGGNDDTNGGSGNDQIWGDAGLDTIVGGTDLGTVTITTTTGKYYQYSPGLYVALSKIDDPGEWVVIPKFHTVENGGALTSLGRADGDAVFVLTNGFNVSKNWNAQGLGQPIDLGPGGQIGADSSVLFNAGGLLSSLLVRIIGENGGPAGALAGFNSNSVVTLTNQSVTNYKIGDSLTGGSGADTFVFNAGDGVDRIRDFQIGVDHLDIQASWFDGNSANGEYMFKAHDGGSLIVFTDSSADGFVDNTAIFLEGRLPGQLDNSIFV